MPCYEPIPGRQDSPGQVVQLWPGMGEQNIAIPCGTCIGCRSSHATQWAHRCGHEASQWDFNIFVTLTYDDDHLPEHGYLAPDDFTRFVKRTRKYLVQSPPTVLQTASTNRIRYFGCGEYGRQNGRPHYHILIFNLDFTDKYKVTQRGEHELFQSETLHTLWPNGTANFGTATPASANYVAQYTLKKQGAGDHDRYGVYRPPPFLRMSQKPPLGSKWLELYKTDLTAGYLVENGHKQAIPRTYRLRLKKEGDQLYDQIEFNIAQNKKRETPEQLEAHKRIHERLKELTERRNL